LIKAFCGMALDGEEGLRALVAMLDSNSAQLPKDKAKSSRLTPRELEVLRYIAYGHGTKQVAGMLGISFKTTARHRSRIMGKLGIHDTASLVRYAIRSGIAKP
jgi:DNA-binding NarL/FixJ family response regulator